MNQGTYSHDERMSLFRALLLISASDRQLDQNERQFLFEIALRLGLDISQEKLGSLREEDLAFPKDELGRMTILYHILFMIRMDRMVHDEEIALCRRLAFHLGMRDEMTDDLIEILLKYSKEEIPVYIMQETILKYLN